MNINKLKYKDVYYDINASLDIDDHSFILNYPSEVNDRSLFEALLNSNAGNIHQLRSSIVDFCIYNENNFPFFLADMAVSYNLGGGPTSVHNFRFSKPTYILTNQERDLESLVFDSFTAEHHVNNLNLLMKNNLIETEYDGFKIALENRPRFNDSNRNISDLLSLKITKTDTNYDDFLDKYHLILTFLTISWGNTPHVDSIMLSKQGLESRLYNEIIDKFYYTKTYLRYPCAIMSDEKLTAENLKSLDQILEKMLIPISVLITSLNNQSYIELRLANMLQSSEGYYFNSFLYDPNKKTINDAIQAYFKFEETKVILKDNETEIITIHHKGVKKSHYSMSRILQNHRNYFSHYKKKSINDLEGMSLYYAFDKFSLAYRAVIFRNITGLFDQKAIIKSTLDMNSFYKQFDINLQFITR